MSDSIEAGAKFQLQSSIEVGVTENGVVKVFDFDSAAVYCTYLADRHVIRDKRLKSGIRIEQPPPLLLPIHFPAFGIHYYKGVDKIYKDPYRGVNPEFTLVDPDNKIVQAVSDPSLRYKIDVPPTFIDDGIYFLIPVGKAPSQIITKHAMSLDESDVSRLLTSLKGRIFTADILKGEALYYIFRGSSLTKIFSKIPKKMLERRHNSVEVMLRTIEGVELPIKMKYLKLCT